MNKEGVENIKCELLVEENKEKELIEDQVSKEVKEEQLYQIKKSFYLKCKMIPEGKHSQVMTYPISN